MKFSEVLGNEHAIERLRNMVDSNRIPHAILISGAAGIPKLALARAFAQYVHCQNQVNGDSCGVCPACKQHQSFNHLDTFYSFPVFKKGTNTTSDIYLEEWKKFLTESSVENYERWLSIIKNENGQPIIYAEESNAIIHKMSLATYGSNHKVLIMWLPEKMNEKCANALLKIIEEPHPDSIFVMVSDRPDKMLPTIMSRVQEIELRKLSTPVVAQYLIEKYGIEEQDAFAIAAPADGNINLAEEAISLDNETDEFREKFISLMRLSYVVDLKGLKLWAEDVVKFKREKECRFLEYAARMVRENYVYNLRNRELNYLTKEEEQFSYKFSPYINELNVEGILQELTNAEIDIKGNGNGKIVLFDLALKMTILIKKKRK